MKNCSKCGIEKNETEFVKKSKTEHAAHCKECENAYRRKRYNKQKEHERYLKKKAKDPERWNRMNNENSKRYWANNKEKFRERARRHAKKRREKYKRTSEQLVKERIYNRKYKIKNKEKLKTHYLVLKALKEGKLIKPKKCEKCKKIGEVHGHHENYNKPYDVIWLCRECHGFIHRLPV